MLRIQQFLKESEPILALIGALLSLTVLGFLVKLFLIMKEAMSQRIKVLEEKSAVKEERRLKELEDRQRAERERDELKKQLTSILGQEKVTIESLVENPALNTITNEVKNAVKNVLQEMQQIEDDVEPPAKDPKEHLELAKAATVAGAWLTAAKHYDKYVRKYPDNWEIHFLRAVAYANIRGDNTTDLASLRAYGDAISLAPKELNQNTQSRLHTYRGAMLKRLKRLDEALSELQLAQKWASESYEVIDNYYNLACVYAMKKDKENMMKCLSQLSLSPPYKHTVKRSVYFKDYWDDEDFLDWSE